MLASLSRQPPVTVDICTAGQRNQQLPLGGLRSYMQNVQATPRSYAARKRVSTHLHSRTAQLVLKEQRASMQHTVGNQRLTGCT
jgi:hypothetical protein